MQWLKLALGGIWGEGTKGLLFFKGEEWTASFTDTHPTSHTHSQNPEEIIYTIRGTYPSIMEKKPRTIPQNLITLKPRLAIVDDKKKLLGSVKIKSEEAPRRQERISKTKT